MHRHANLEQHRWKNPFGKVYLTKSMIVLKRSSTGTRAPARGESSPPVSVKHLCLLNEVSQQPLLLTGAADGAVRVYRGFASAATTRLATAWQGVPVAHGTSPQPVAPSVFCTDVSRGMLFAAGGSQPGVVQCWSLQREFRTIEVRDCGFDRGSILIR